MKILTERLRELTPRELDVLLALTEGLPNKQIGQRLFVSEQTIKFHLTNIYRTLEVTNRTEAAIVMATAQSAIVQATTQRGGSTDGLAA